MKRISWLVIVASVCQATQTIGIGSAAKDDVRFQYEARIEPPLAGQVTSSFGGGIYIDASSGFHRFLYDRSTRRYFGYDLNVVAEPNSRIRVSFQPLSLEAKTLSKPVDETWTRIPLPPLPPPQAMQSGDTIAVDLMINPSTGQKLVDYLTVFSGASQGGGDRMKAAALEAAKTRDFTVEDAVLRLARPAVKTNGSPSGEWGGEISGPAVWFYVAGHGRFAMTLAPNSALGFRKMGEVRGSTLIVRSGYDVFQIECRESIAGDAAYNLYVRHDAQWRPRGEDASAKFLLGAADKAGALVPR